MCRSLYALFVTLILCLMKRTSSLALLPGKISHRVGTNAAFGGFNAVVRPEMSLQSTPTSSEGTKKKRTKEERLLAATKGLNVHVVGLSIHHAAVEVREKLAVPEASWNEASAEICADGHIEEAAVLSTCNRFEVYYAASDPRKAMASLTKHLSRRSGLPVSTLRKNIFALSGDDAVWHLFRVSGGLDSLIVGEGQILSQVRQCHLHSIEEDGSGGKMISRLLNQAVAAGKRVRSETGIR